MDILTAEIEKLKGDIARLELSLNHIKTISEQTLVIVREMAKAQMQAKP